jgi:hypothetical protein
MTHRRQRTLLRIATVIGGLLAGETVDRFVIGRHAWNRVGTTAWAAYSRHADLGPGRFVYPSEAIAGVALLAAAAARRPLPPALAAALALQLAGLLLTAKAGPYMLAAARHTDPSDLRADFDGFMRWSTVRGAFHVLGFGAEVAALATTA